MNSIVNMAEYEREVINADTPVLVDFYADWCDPCMKFAPVLESVSEKMNMSVKFVKINVDHAPDLAKNHFIDIIPSILLFKNGKLLDRMKDVMREEEVLGWIKKTIAV